MTASFVPRRLGWIDGALDVVVHLREIFCKYLLQLGDWRVVPVNAQINYWPDEAVDDIQAGRAHGRGLPTGLEAGCQSVEQALAQMLAVVALERLDHCFGHGLV